MSNGNAAYIQQIIDSETEELQEENAKLKEENERLWEVILAYPPCLERMKNDAVQRHDWVAAKEYRDLHERLTGRRRSDEKD